jgi:hypothetical protein
MPSDDHLPTGKSSIANSYLLTHISQSQASFVASIFPYLIPPLAEEGTDGPILQGIVSALTVRVLANKSPSYS